MVGPGPLAPFPPSRGGLKIGDAVAAVGIEEMKRAWSHAQGQTLARGDLHGARQADRENVLCRPVGAFGVRQAAVGQRVCTQGFHQTQIEEEIGLGLRHRLEMLRPHADEELPASLSRDRKRFGPARGAAANLQAASVLGDGTSTVAATPASRPARISETLSPIINDRVGWISKSFIACSSKPGSGFRQRHSFL